MKLVKSLLLGSAAGLAAVTGAQAADLPVRREAPAAVDYVRVCSTYGAGFFFVPGSADSCLRIGGRVRADLLFQEPISRVQDSVGFLARGRLNVDYRTATAFGLLRAYIRYEITRVSGTPAGSTGVSAQDADIQQAFVQFGGLTAGRVTSFFSNADLPTQHFGTLRFDDAPDVPLFAYTFQFGGGFSATLAVEDSIQRRVSNPLAFGALIPPDIAPIALVPGGQRVPDLVGNVRMSGTWGSAQVSGAVRQVREVGEVGRVNPVTGRPLPVVADSEVGWAVGLSGHLNVPALGPGDAIWAYATYTDGAFGYLNGGQDATVLAGAITAGPLSLPVADAFINPFTGDIETNRAWSIAAGFNHYWTPQFRTNVFGSWMRFDASGGAAFTIPTTPATVAAGTAGATIGLVDFDEFRIGANAIWSPVSGLNLGVEVLYINVDPRRPTLHAEPLIGGGTFIHTAGSEDIWQGRLRVQRDF